MTANSVLARTAACAFFAAASLSVNLAALLPASAASEIRVVVNREPITTYQIGQRAAFLKLRHAPASAEAATDELIDEAVKKQEIRRRGIRIPDALVNASYENFAKSNKLTADQLGQILTRAGFSEKGFKEYIRVQMGWGQAVQLNLRQTEKLSEQDVVQKMLAQGGDKPSTTEYTLQQVIFVIPAKQRGTLTDQRTTEANQLRQRFTSCPETYEVAKGLKDVTVRELGRVAQPELPDRWKKEIEVTAAGRTTKPLQTENGVEFIAVCATRSVSDDKAAAMVFQEQELQAMGAQKEPDKAFLQKLKEKAQIVRR